MDKLWITLRARQAFGFTQILRVLEIIRVLGCLSILQNYVNIDKYSNRYGSKGTVDDYRKDLMKIAHYAIIALYCHDKKYSS